MPSTVENCNATQGGVLYRVLALIASVSMASCSAFVSTLYQIPEGDEAFAELQFYPNGASDAYLFVNGTDCTERVRIPVEYRPHPFAYTTTPLPIQVDRELALYWNHLSNFGRTSCSTLVSFIPRAGVKYRAVFLRFEGACGTTIERSMSGNEGTWLPEASLRSREYVPAILASSSSCR